jgi:hypothetical protein
MAYDRIGWHGLVKCKDTLRCQSLGKSRHIRGVWVVERLYPGLKTNNLVGTYEFGDFPMTEALFGVKSGQSDGQTETRPMSAGTQADRAASFSFELPPRRSSSGKRAGSLVLYLL